MRTFISFIKNSRTLKTVAICIGTIFFLHTSNLHASLLTSQTATIAMNFAWDNIPFSKAQIGDYKVMRLEGVRNLYFIDFRNPEILKEIKEQDPEYLVVFFQNLFPLPIVENNKLIGVDFYDRKAISQNKLNLIIHWDIRAGLWKLGLNNRSKANAGKNLLVITSSGIENENLPEDFNKEAFRSPEQFKAQAEKLIKTDGKIGDLARAVLLETSGPNNEPGSPAGFLIGVAAVIIAVVAIIWWAKWAWDNPPTDPAGIRGW